MACRQQNVSYDAKSEDTVGELCGKLCPFYEWFINDFFKLSSEVDTFCRSPTFEALDAKWFLQLYPNGATSNKSEGWITLCLCKIESKRVKHSLHYKLGIQREDGIEYQSFQAEEVFLEGDYCGSNLLKRSVLTGDRYLVSPSGVLTIFCLLYHDGSSTESIAKQISEYDDWLLFPPVESSNQENSLSEQTQEEEDPNFDPNLPGTISTTGGKDTGKSEVNVLKGNNEDRHTNENAVKNEKDEVKTVPSYSFANLFRKCRSFRGKPKCPTEERETTKHSEKLEGHETRGKKEFNSGGDVMDTGEQIKYEIGDENRLDGRVRGVDTDEKLGEQETCNKNGLEERNGAGADDKPEEHETGNENGKNDVEADETFENSATSPNLKGFAVLSRNFEKLFHNKQLCDVTVKVQDRTFHAHKLILMARSSVFASMLLHDMKERNTGIVDIADSDPDSFQDFLSYLYSGKLEMVSSKNVLGLYVTSDKYDIKELKEECVCFMMENLSLELICDVIALALRYGETKLLEHSTEYFIENARKILFTVQWQIFIEEYPVSANELYIKTFENAMNKR